MPTVEIPQPRIGGVEQTSDIIDIINESFRGKTGELVMLVGRDAYDRVRYISKGLVRLPNCSIVFSHFMGILSGEEMVWVETEDEEKDDFWIIPTERHTYHRGNNNIVKTSDGGIELGRSDVMDFILYTEGDCDYPGRRLELAVGYENALELFNDAQMQYGLLPVSCCRFRSLADNSVSFWDMALPLKIDTTTERVPQPLRDILTERREQNLIEIMGRFAC